MKKLSTVFLLVIIITLSASSIAESIVPGADLKHDDISKDEQGIYAAIVCSGSVERKAPFGDNINRVRDFCSRIEYPTTEEYFVIGYRNMAYLKAVFSFSDVARVEFCSDNIDQNTLLQCLENESIIKPNDEAHYFEISVPDKQYCFDARDLPDQLSELMTMDLTVVLISPYYIPGLPDDEAMNLHITIYDYLSGSFLDDDGIIISIPFE